MKKINWILHAEVLFLLLVVLTVGLIAAKNDGDDSAPGICIYAVSVSTISNFVNIAWTSTPCQDLDVTNIEDFNLMQKSSFNPGCAFYSVQARPNIYLPVVDYNSDFCDFDFNNQRNADEDEADGND